MFFSQNKQRKQFSLLNKKLKQEPSAQKNSQAIERTGVAVRGLKHFPPLILAAV